MTEFRITRGFAEPVLWGLRQGYSIAEIAMGLDCGEAVVVAAVECWGPRWMALQVRTAWPRGKAIRPQPSIDPTRNDPAYRAWARAQRGAATRLDLLEALK